MSRHNAGSSHTITSYWLRWRPAVRQLTVTRMNRPMNTELDPLESCDYPSLIPFVHEIIAA